MIALLLTLNAFAQDCENPEWIANETEEYIGNFMLDDARAAIARAETAFGCSVAADPAVLARLFNAEGTVALLTEDTAGATLAYGAAARAHGETWNSNYGEDARKAYDMAASTLTLMGTGTLEFLPAPVGLVVSIDGSEAEAPFVLGAGLHLVQVAKPGEPASFAKRVRVTPGAATRVVTGLTRDGPAVAAGEVIVIERSPIPELAKGLSAPFAKGDQGWADGAGVAINFKEVREIAGYDHEGNQAGRAHRFGKTGAALGVPMATVGGYAGYVLLWDITTGHNAAVNQNEGQAGAFAVGSLAVAAVGTVLVLNGLGNKKRKAAVREAADRVVQGKAL